ncbi:MAG: hypothetical protein QOD99_2246, partial [Chthoniobacter sp.]|nr:hypothetical protein [Chthoniobacter sp.]
MDPQLSNGFTFRRCLILCAPALLLAVVVRALFIASIPEAFYGADSNSYFDSAVQLWTKHHFVFGEKRRGLYPLILCLAPLFPGNTAQFIALLQHALGLVTIISAGWITGHVTRFRNIWVPVVTCLCAILPQMLWYEHELIADSMVLTAFAFAAALGFPTRDLRGWRLFQFFLAAMLIVALKPHGRPLWLGLVLAAALITGNPLRWGWKNFAVLAATVALMLATGSSQQGGWLFLSSALPLIKTEGNSWPEYRQTLRPVVERLHEDWRHYPWQQLQYKKALGSKGESKIFGEAWPKLVRD